MSFRHRFSRHAARRESLLFVTPVMPALSGNGLAMRAAFTLLALASRYRVSLVVVPRYSSPAGRFAPAAVQAVCASVTTLAGEISAGTLPVRQVDILHLFRLETIPLAEPLLAAFGGRARLWIDFDDVESLVHRRLAALHRERGEDAAAEHEAELARQAEAREVAALQLFERVFLASAADREHLPLHGVAEVRHLPNVLPLPDLLPDTPPRDEIDIVMVGTLGYFPNAEGALWFARDVLPRLRQTLEQPLVFRVVGAGWHPLVEELRRVPHVEIAGRVPDVTPYYERAHVAVVPIRAGSGSRIKLIEAFGLGRAVVATTMGADGIDVVDGRHLLLTDDDASFAVACQRLITDAPLRSRLIANARKLAQERHTPEAAAATVATWS